MYLFLTIDTFELWSQVEVAKNHSVSGTDISSLYFSTSSWHPFECHDDIYRRVSRGYSQMLTRAQSKARSTAAAPQAAAAAAATTTASKTMESPKSPSIKEEDEVKIVNPRDSGFEEGEEEEGEIRLPISKLIQPPPPPPPQNNDDDNDDDDDDDDDDDRTIYYEQEQQHQHQQQQQQQRQCQWQWQQQQQQQPPPSSLPASDLRHRLNYHSWDNFAHFSPPRRTSTTSYRRANDDHHRRPAPYVSARTVHIRRVDYLPMKTKNSLLCNNQRRKYELENLFDVKIDIPRHDHKMYMPVLIKGEDKEIVDYVTDKIIDV